MSEVEFHRVVVYGELGLAAVTFAALFFVTAPYGRHFRGGWGPSVSSRLGWLVMESPPVFVFGAIFIAGDAALKTAPLCLLGLWQLHYLHRTFVFRVRRRGDHRPMPIVVVALGVVFNVINAYVNARWISHLGQYSTSWLADPRFIAGAVVFLVGFSINVHADGVLRELRPAGSTEYRIPKGGLYQFVSCPNYLGEIVEWGGWALATWSLAGTSFAVYTAANLLPRALSHHAWYHDTFEDYPKARRAVLPFVL